MKAAVRLAIAVAALLVVSNVAFASCPDPICYSVDITKDDGYVANRTWRVCLYDNGSGWLQDMADGGVPLVLFGGGPMWYNQTGNPPLGGNPNWTIWLTQYGSTPSLYIQATAPGMRILTGVGSATGSPWTIMGKKITCPVL